MANTNKLPAQFKSFQVMYWAMAAMQVFLGVAVYVLISTGTVGKPDYTLALTLQKVALFFIPASMAAGYFLFKYLLVRIDSKLVLEEKVKKYFTLILIRGALFEVGFLFCCVAAFITGVLLFLYMAPVLFLIFLLLRLTPEGITSDLQLSPSDSGRLVQS